MDDPGGRVDLSRQRDAKRNRGGDSLPLRPVQQSGVVERLPREIGEYDVASSALRGLARSWRCLPPGASPTRAARRVPASAISTATASGGAGQGEAGADMRAPF